MRLALVALVLLALISCCAGQASLQPDDVVVVMNNHPDVALASRAVARYYCDRHSIPYSRIAEITATPGEKIQPHDFMVDVLADTGSPQSLVDLLTHRPGFDINDPGSDPTKCILLCYGVPIKIAGDNNTEVVGSVDSTLALLFNQSPWGKQPVGDYLSTSGQRNPFQYAEGGLFDFGDFRTSPYNGVVESPPPFMKVRMLSGDRAIAVGGGGMVYRGERSGATWNWTAIPDEKKGFIRSGIDAISVIDPNHAVIATDCGSILLVTSPDDGTACSVLRQGWKGCIATSDYTGVSFWDQANGYVVGVPPHADSDTPTYAIWRYGNGTLTAVWTTNTGGGGKPNNDFDPHDVAAVDATHVWVTGRGGIWRYNGTTWMHEYVSASSTWDIWVGKVGEAYTGWAIDGSGSILRYDGATWSVVPGAYASFPGGADLAVYDPTHFAVACSSQDYIQYDGASISIITTDSTVTSVAWAGGGAALAVSGDPTVKSGTVSSGTCAWTASLTVPSFTWKMRYLVCRLDGYSDPVDPGTGIPQDVKNIIDRSVLATGYGSATTAGLKFALDGPWKSGTAFDPTLMGRLRGTVGAQNVIEDESEGVYFNSNGVVTGNVVGYSSSGSYHPNANNLTAWYRPTGLTWAPGAIGMYKNVSGDEYYVRRPQLVYQVQPPDTTNTANREAYKLKVYFESVGSDPNGRYSTHWVGLHRALDGSLLTSALFDRTEQFGGVYQRTAVVDLSSVDWNNADNQNTYVAVHFPVDDPLHSQDSAESQQNGIARWPLSGGSSTVCNSRGDGVICKAIPHQSLAGELIRSGCSATAGNVWEPYGGGCPVPETILRMYGGGCTWAESAYMGMPSISWLEIAVGDPLMCPFQMRHPTAALTAPGPGLRVRGTVPISASAAADGDGSVTSLAFWARGSGKRIWLGDDKQAPYECCWDTMQMANGNRVFPDGQYDVQTAAYQSGNAFGRGEATRSVTVDSTLPQVTLTMPAEDDAVLVTPYTVSAQVSGGTPTGVQFWLYRGPSPLLVGDTSGPYECTITSAVAEGVYELQAVAYGDNGSYASYSPRRRILLLHEPPVSKIRDLAAMADNTELLLANLPVTAGTSAVGGAFYIEDPDWADERGPGTLRAPEGIRVATMQIVQAGAKATVRGILHISGTGLTERYIEATGVWAMGMMDLPKPLAMPLRDLGGIPPASNPGVTGAVSVYNTGLLVTVAGRVAYRGQDFMYVDDPGLYDGNTLPVWWIWNAGRVRDPSQYGGIAGVRAYLPTGVNAQVGDYVSITGISSTIWMAGTIQRYLNPCGTSGVTVPRSYLACQKYDGHFYPDCVDPASPEAQIVQLGTRIRLTDASVQGNAGTELTVIDQYGGTSTVNAATGFSVGQTITVLGTVVEGIAGDEIDAEMIYSSQAPGAGSMPMAPAASGLMASEALVPDEPGGIGWALSQPDGTSVSLSAVQVASILDGYFGVKERGESLSAEPRLLISRTCQVGQSWVVDVQGTITTLGNGQRAIAPASVWLYTDANGRPAPPWAWMTGSSWPHKQQIQ